jgi:hypothetical protein
VDINDVTWLIATFGNLAADGGCPWDGTRDADFSNNGAVGSEDYSALSGNWLTATTCACTVIGPMPLAPVQTRVRARDLHPWLAERADLDRDGVVTHEDVALFEKRHGLPDALSRAIRDTESGRRP